MTLNLGMEDILSKKQHGFKKGISTETALHKVIAKVIAKKGDVLGTFLDIEGAFDNVSFKTISEAIDQSPLDQSPLDCPNCTDTEETVANYIGQCPAYSCIRGDTLGTYYDSINDIMDKNNIDLIIKLELKVLKDC